MTIQIDRTLVNRLLAHAQQSPELEVCGLIGATRDGPQNIYPVRNVAAPAERLFAMDPQEQIAAMRQMRERGEDLFAIYHSHPHAPAVPSAFDLGQAAYPDALYLIISLNTKGVLEMQGYRLRGQQMDAVELEMGGD